MYQYFIPFCGQIILYGLNIPLLSDLFINLQIPFNWQPFGLLWLLQIRLLCIFMPQLLRQRHWSLRRSERPRSMQWRPQVLQLRLNAAKHEHFKIKVNLIQKYPHGNIQNSVWPHTGELWPSTLTHTINLHIWKFKNKKIQNKVKVVLQWNTEKFSFSLRLLSPSLI